MMAEHPIPQNIASFEFKLFGNLTVRQFVTLAIPLSLAALIFFSNLSLLIRLPFSLMIALLAFVVALVPINGRSLDKWVVIFIKAILAPTQRVWIKEPKTPEFLNIVTKPVPTHDLAEPLIGERREKLLAYLRLLPRANVLPLDIKEQIALERLGVTLGQGEGWSVAGKLLPAIIWAGEKPEIQTREPLYAQSSLPQLETAAKIAEHAKPYALGGLAKKLGPGVPLQFELGGAEPGGEEARAPRHLASEINFAQEVVIPIKTANKQLKLITGVGKTKVRKLHFAPPVGFDLSKLPIRGEKRLELSEELKRRFHLAEDIFTNNPKATGEVQTVKEPKMAAAPIAKKPVQHTAFQSGMLLKPTVVLKTPKNVSFKEVKTESADAKISLAGQPVTGATPGVFLKRAQMIPLTDKPNVLSGQITRKDGAPIVGAIFIVRDANGIPLRALKTNKLGQFLSATPLANGKYTIEVEDQFAKFDTFMIDLGGQVIAPFEIRAKE